MTDDIVTRLRSIGLLKCYMCQEFVCDGYDVDCCSTYDDRDNCHDREPTILQAADEIERLRAEVRALETERDQWQRQANRD